MRILVVAGLSGGHIFPAVSLLDALRENRRDIETLLVLPRPQNLERGLSQESIGLDSQRYGRIKYISSSSLRFRADLKNFVEFFNFLKSSLESLFIILIFRPDVVVAFGSLACVPTVIFSWLLRIKTVIHEQNVLPGKASRLLAIFADRIAISFPQTENHLQAYKSKISLTGNPVRQGLRRCDKKISCDFLGLSDDKITLLVMGGSQGSHAVNLGFIKAISGIANKNRLQVVHLTGSKDEDFLRRSYRELKIDARLFAFLKDMQYAYSACDLVVSRAGATTISEISYFKIPAIVIPYPFAYRHQLLNARVLEALGAVVTIEDKELNGHRLRDVLDELINNPSNLKRMGSGYNNITWPQTADLLVKEVTNSP